MTHIECNTNGSEFSITSIGHADYAPVGKDIVCAGISILLQTIIVYLDAEDYDIRDGALWVHGKGEKAMGVYEFVLTGLKLIEINYPSHIEVTEGCTINSESPLI